MNNRTDNLANATSPTGTPLPQLELGVSAGDLVDVVQREIEQTLK